MRSAVCEIEHVLVQASQVAGLPSLAGSEASSVQDGENILYGTGDDPFLKGIRTWLKARQYNTSTTDQLWEALSSAVGRNVGTWMYGWSYESGFPLVRVTLGGITNRDVSISQVCSLGKGPSVALPMQIYSYHRCGERHSTPSECFTTHTTAQPSHHCSGSSSLLPLASKLPCC